MLKPLSSGSTEPALNLAKEGRGRVQGAPQEKALLRSSYFFNRLLRTALVVATPIFVLLAYTLYADTRALEERAHQAVMAAARDTAEEVDQALSRVEGFMDFLMTREEVLKMDAPGCSSLLKGFANIDLMLRNVGVFDTSGRLICVAKPSPNALSTYGNEPWFKAALAQKGRYFSAPYLGTLSQKPVMSLTEPVLDEAGTQIGS